MTSQKRQYTAFGMLLATATFGGCDQGESIALPNALIEDDSVKEVQQPVVTDCSYFPEIGYLPWEIDFDRSMIIRDLAVVDDPCRSRPNGGDPSPQACTNGGTPGIWSFGRLISKMAGANDAAQFVTNWLSTWTTNQVVNGFTVAARPNIKTKLLNPWWSVSGCGPFPASCPTLRLDKAPFRLLAIVNRIDLSGPGGPYGEPSGPDANLGELRFVFGALDLSTTPPTTLDTTFILEYKLPPTNDLFGWALNFYYLSDPSLGSTGSATYNAFLEAITAAVTENNANPGKPNLGSSIGQIRTNDGAFGPSMPTVWELREQILDCTGAPDNNHCMLKPTTVKRTPANSLNGNLSGITVLDTFFLTEALNILDEGHSIPDSFLGGSSLARAGAASGLDMWDISNPLLYTFNGGTIDPLARHLFGLGTCNGCHYHETFTDRFHITPRDLGSIAQLSPFLKVSSNPDSTDTKPTEFHPVTDPAGLISLQKYNEPWRRRCELRRILWGDPIPLTTPAGVRTH